MIASKIIRATGRRKSSIAQIMVRPVSKKIESNISIYHRHQNLSKALSLNKFFPSKIFVQLIEKPLVATKLENKFNIVLKVHGGGFSGQAGAARLALSRALSKINVDNRKILKANGLLTRDARVKERRKPGLKKARKAPQFSKR